MGFCYAITSGKGGTGKSTVAAGLGQLFAVKGYKTLLVDMDEGLRCLDLMLGVEQELVFDLSDIVNGRDSEDATYKIDSSDNLYLILFIFAFISFTRQIQKILLQFMSKSVLRMFSSRSFIGSGLTFRSLIHF